MLASKMSTNRGRETCDRKEETNNWQDVDGAREATNIRATNIVLPRCNATESTLEFRLPGVSALLAAWCALTVVVELMAMISESSAAEINRTSRPKRRFRRIMDR